MARTLRVTDGASIVAENALFRAAMESAEFAITQSAINFSSMVVETSVCSEVFIEAIHHRAPGLG